LVAQAVASAVEEARFDPGTFSFLHAGGPREMVIGESLVRHAAVRAVGFTGSLGGGMALAKMAAERPDPIPVFAEMGSTNPVFVLPSALESQAEAIAERVFSSATNANGQMCTCPGLLFIARGNGMDAFLASITKLADAAAPQLMLSQRTRGNFERRVSEVADVAGVELRAGRPPEPAADKDPHLIKGSPLVFRTNFETFRKTPTLHEEVFGPALIMVVCESAGQLADAAASIQGTLTGTIWAAGADESHARRLQRILEQRVGRLIFNGVPTGVEVCHAMVHGGPYPATNQAHATAVGPTALVRWCRPVCYQNVPEGFLPAELRNANPLKIRRLVNGAWVEAGGTA
jgi:NADP-dependent aldehyde dehydrogenase